MKSHQIPALSITIISISGSRLQAAELISRLAERTLCCALSKKSMAYSFLNICTKKKILCSFTLPQVVPNQQDILSSVEHKRGQILILAAIFNAITNNSTLLNIKSGFIDKLKNETVKMKSKCNESHALMHEFYASRHAG